MNVALRSFPFALFVLLSCTPASPPGGQCNAASGAAVVSSRCLGCHSAALVGPQARSNATVGVDFDTDGDVRKHADRIRFRTLTNQTMPPEAPIPDCESALLDQHLTTLVAGQCLPACSGRACGPDGCGGTCGGCSPGLACEESSGRCLVASCTPDCTGRGCGTDGCTGSCGTCDTGKDCNAAGTCVCAPQCTGRTCGADGCGGTCGTCPVNSVCNPTGQCTCLPSCSGKACGSDGCGGSCGSCAAPQACNATNQCICVPSCTGRQCGSDGCSGTCGTCAGVLVCNTQTGRCGGSCIPSCAGRTCGDDGCGGSCGTCPTTQSCTSSGQCACVPNCSGKACGPNGCGGTCGACSTGLLCNASGQCGCTASCTGRICGDDGCGGSCGTCGGGEACSPSGQCGCAPSCSGKSCGPDGCGGSCGTCSSAQTCSADACVYAQKTFGTDVFPIFQAAGCAGAGCHTGVVPAGSLKLTSASIGHAELVNVPSTQCTTRLLVKPNDLAGSYLLNKLLGTGMCLGTQMPKAGVSLSQAELDTVRAWISTGAVP